jgi:hypothetical protein
LVFRNAVKSVLARQVDQFMHLNGLTRSAMARLSDFLGRFSLAGRALEIVAALFLVLGHPQERHVDEETTDDGAEIGVFIALELVMLIG